MVESAAGEIKVPADTETTETAKMNALGRLNMVISGGREGYIEDGELLV